MSNSIQNVNKVNAGTCPHGCAPSACPICSGMGGGGGLRAGERIKKPGELSYHECAMIGAMMKARAEADKQHENNIAKHALNVKEFEVQLQNMSARLAEIVSQMSSNPILKPVTAFIQGIIIPALNIVKTVTQSIQNISNKISQLKIDIQDKLNAIFGELKAFINKKVSEFVSVIKNKLIFKIFKRNNTKDDETKIDEDKKLFRLKTFISKLLKRKDDTEDKSRP